SFCLGDVSGKLVFSSEDRHLPHCRLGRTHCAGVPRSPPRTPERLRCDSRRKSSCTIPPRLPHACHGILCLPDRRISAGSRFWAHVLAKGYSRVAGISRRKSSGRKRTQPTDTEPKGTGDGEREAGSGFEGSRRGAKPVVEYLSHAPRAWAHDRRE